MNERQQIVQSIMMKAVADDEFRAAMLADPRAAIGKEFEIEVPESIEIVVHENDANTVHLPLPAEPAILSEQELGQVTGGHTCAYI